MEVKSTSFLGPSRLKTTDESTPELQMSELADAIRIAVPRSGFTHTQLCAYMDKLDPGTWSKQLDGDGHISLSRMRKAPPAFWREFIPLIAAHYGMTASHGTGISQSIARCLVSLADVIGRLELSVSADRKVG
jgi:hypothetical protein